MAARHPAGAARTGRRGSSLPRLRDIGYFSGYRAEMRAAVADDGGPFNSAHLVGTGVLPPGPPCGSTPGRFEARFDTPGTYVFRVTVTDAQGLTATEYAAFVAGPGRAARTHGRVPAALPVRERSIPGLDRRHERG